MSSKRCRNSSGGGKRKVTLSRQDYRKGPKKRDSNNE